MEDFEEFQIKEYERVAEAHFKTNELISSFFRYYLVIMTVPAPVVAALLTLSISDKISQTTLANLFLGQNTAIAALLGGTGFLGLLMMCYIMNLRFDALLYARQVNGIRRFFFDSTDLHPIAKTRLGVLPQSTALPKYWEGPYFLPVIFTFALINSTYLLSAFAFWVASPASAFDPNATANLFSRLGEGFVWGITWFSAWVILHVAIYWNAARYRELGYLKSPRIGIDIDGTIGNHVTQFCSLLKRLTDRDISPEQITAIPVSSIDTLELNRIEHEIPVFHEPSYWTEMTVLSNAESHIADIRQKLGYQVFIFTDRRWPQLAHIDESGRHTLLRRWHEIANKTLESKHWLSRTWCQILLDFEVLPAIYFITEGWLKQAKIPYDGLVMDDLLTGIAKLFQRGPRNRFEAVLSGQYRAFIEDHWQNAVRLSPYCEFVFLYGHPYNNDDAVASQSPGTDLVPLPRNVIRVSDWRDVYRYLALVT